jgi:hypothetical protein
VRLEAALPTGSQRYESIELPDQEKNVALRIRWNAGLGKDRERWKLNGTYSFMRINTLGSGFGTLEFSINQFTLVTIPFFDSNSSNSSN